MTKWIIGGHVDTADAVTQAAARGADIAQISLGDPKSWKKPVCDFPGGSLALREAAGEAGLTLVVHSAFVINVASLNNRIRIPSRKLLQQTLDAAAEVGAMGVVVHGGHVRAGEPIEKGQDNWRKAIDGLEMSVPLFVENTAGGDNAMARFLERLSVRGRPSVPRQGTRTSGSVWIPATLSRPVSTWRVWSTMCVALRVGSTWCTLMILRVLSGRGGIATPTWGRVSARPIPSSVSSVLRRPRSSSRPRGG